MPYSPMFFQHRPCMVAPSCYDSVWRFALWFMLLFALAPVVGIVLKIVLLVMSTCCMFWPLIALAYLSTRCDASACCDMDINQMKQCNTKSKRCQPTSAQHEASRAHKEKQYAMWEGADMYGLTIEIPGIRQADLTITAHAAQAGTKSTPCVVVTGATNGRKVDTTVRLPHDADPDHATVEHADGVLSLTVPKIPKRSIHLAVASVPPAKPTAVETPKDLQEAAAAAAETKSPNEEGNDEGWERWEVQETAKQ